MSEADDITRQEGADPLVHAPFPSVPTPAPRRSGGSGEPTAPLFSASLAAAVTQGLPSRHRSGWDRIGDVLVSRRSVFAAAAAAVATAAVVSLYYMSLYQGDFVSASFVDSGAIAQSLAPGDDGGGSDNLSSLQTDKMPLLQDSGNEATPRALKVDEDGLLARDRVKGDGEADRASAAASPADLGQSSETAGQSPDEATTQTAGAEDLDESEQGNTTDGAEANPDVSDQEQAVVDPSDKESPTEGDSIGAIARPVDRIEAEMGQAVGAARVRSDHDGYSGDGFVGDITTVGSGVRFTYYSSTGGQRPIVVRYSAGDTGSDQATERMLSLTVNDVPGPRAVLQPTESWSEWALVAGTLELQAGENTITIFAAAGDNGWVNIDYVEIG